MNKKYQIVLYVFIAEFFLFSCMERFSSANYLYKKRDVILSEFSNMSIFKRGDRVLLLFSFDNDINQFGFINDHGDIKFEDARINFDISKINGLQNINLNDTLKYHKILEQYISSKLRLMKSFHIREVNMTFKSLGIFMKIYMEDGGVFLYIPGINRVNNRNWVRYLEVIDKYDDNWYYDPIAENSLLSP